MTALEFVLTHNIQICEDTLKDLEGFTGPIEEYFDLNERGEKLLVKCVRYAKDATASIITQKQLDWVVAYYSWDALVYLSHVLTPEQLDWLAVRYSWGALVHASHLLTPDRLAWCKALHPYSA